jgi:GNAT superfamily N-acetyltransferase
MIRDAIEADIPAIVERGAEFFEEAGWSDVSAYDPDTMAQTLANMIAAPGGIVLVAYDDDRLVGMAGGLVYPAYFNVHHLTGQEMFWWVAPEYRSGLGSKMLEALEASAKDRGCHSWSMICLAKVRPEVVGRLYERRGYRASERSYIKSL